MGVRFFIGVIAVAAALAPQVSLAEAPPNSKAAVEELFRPLKSKDLNAYLPERFNDAGRFGGETTFFSGTGACPQQVNIGSVADDSTIYGGTDINVAIQGDVIIQCGSGF
jgi:hypothetical protein